MSDASKRSIEEWQSAIRAWSREKGWDKGFPHVPPKNPDALADDDGMVNLIGMKLALVHTEVAEATEALRAGRIALYVDPLHGKPEGVAVELADTVIRILDLAALLGLDIGTAMAVKMDYNAHRAHRHGGLKA